MRAVIAMVVQIGRCIGCAKIGRLMGLHEDACADCLLSVRRGPRWLELARRVRSDRAFALEAYMAMPETCRKHFLRVFGTSALCSVAGPPEEASS